MNPKEIRKKFLQIEDELDLFSRQIQGVHFWEIARYIVYKQIEVKHILGQPRPEVEPTFVNLSEKVLRSARNIIIKNPYLVSQKDILFLGFARRKLQEDGKWWDICCDPIIENLKNLNYTYFYLETFYLKKHLTPAKTESIGYLDFIHALAVLYRNLGKIFFSFTKEEKYLLQDIRNKIQIQFDTEINLESLVRKKLLDRKCKLTLYKLLLKKIKPKLVILAFSSIGQGTFIEACKGLRIPVIGLQAAAISKYHIAYSFPGSKRMKHTFPDYFFTFGNFWKNRAEFPINKEKIYNVGYPFLEEGFKKYTKIPKKNQILFISQYSVGKELSKFALELSKSIPSDYEIVYKIHPGYYDRWRKCYLRLINSKVKVIDDSNISLYRLFAESKIQIGVYSTAIYEGLAFGLKTYLLDHPMTESMEYLIKNKYVTVISSVTELKRKLREDMSNSKIDLDVTEFFEKNSIDKMSNKIEEIMNLSRQK